MRVFDTRLDAHLIDRTNWKYQCENCELLSGVKSFNDFIEKFPNSQIDPVITAIIRVTDILNTLYVGKRFLTYLHESDCLSAEERAWFKHERDPFIVIGVLHTGKKCEWYRIITCGRVMH